MTHLDSILKNWDITLPTNIHIVRAVVFPVVIHGCDSWTVKKAEHLRIDTFKLWCWRRLLGVPWTVRRSNQSIPKGNQTWLFFGRMNAEAEAPVLWPPEVKNWLIWKDPECWERLKAGGEGDDRGWNGYIISAIQRTWIWANGKRLVEDRGAWCAVVHGVPKSWTRLSNWTITKALIHLPTPLVGPLLIYH